MKAVFYSLLIKNRHKLLFYFAVTIFDGFSGFKNFIAIMMWMFLNGFSIMDSEFEQSLPLSLKNHIKGLFLFDISIFLLHLGIICSMAFLIEAETENLINYISIAFLLPFILTNKFFKGDAIIKALTISFYVVTVIVIGIIDFANPFKKLVLVTFISIGLYLLNVIDVYKNKKEYYYVEG